MKRTHIQKIVFLGLPGSGKGTHAGLLSTKFNLSHLSTGEVFRAEIRKGTELGKLASELIDNGNYIPDELLLKIVESHIVSTPNCDGFLFDGYPRTIPQAEIFETYLKAQSEELDFVFFLDVSEEEARNRLHQRAEKSNRKDDSSTLFDHRFEVYYNLTEPLIDFYRKRKKLIRIDSDGTIPEVHERIVDAYTNFYNSKL